MRRVPFFLGTALVCAVAAAMLRPDLWFLINTPTGGDMGAHVLGPATMRELLFEHGRITLNSGPWVKDFVDQLLQCPDPKSHDDMIDALSYIDQMATTPLPFEEEDTFEIYDEVAGY